jgi:uncharacterized protein YbbK (DUF523 family)
MNKKKVAISACLLGNKCRYDGSDNHMPELIEKLDDYELIAFCPEDFAFGSPRPTMDLVETDRGIRAISNLNSADLTPPVQAYADAFFDTHLDIELFIGKDRSPSCGVHTARLYDGDKNLITDQASGLMAKRADRKEIEAWDAEDFLVGSK